MTCWSSNWALSLCNVIVDGVAHKFKFQKTSWQNVDFRVGKLSILKIQNFLKNLLLWIWLENFEMITANIWIQISTIKIRFYEVFWWNISHLSSVQQIRHIKRLEIHKKPCDLRFILCIRFTWVNRFRFLIIT